MENEENVEANGDDDIDNFEGDDVEMNADEIEMDSNTGDSGTNKSFCIYELISIVTRSPSDKQRQKKSSLPPAATYLRRTFLTLQHCNAASRAAPPFPHPILPHLHPSESSIGPELLYNFLTLLKQA